MPQALRIPPRLDDAGQPLEIDPPCGGAWLRESDGALVPADEATAASATQALGLGAEEPTPAALLALDQAHLNPTREE